MSRGRREADTAAIVATVLSREVESRRFDEWQSPAGRVAANSGCDSLQQKKRNVLIGRLGDAGRGPWSWINLRGAVGWSVVGEGAVQREANAVCLLFFYFLLCLSKRNIPQQNTVRCTTTAHHSAPPQREDRAAPVNLVVRSQSDSGPHRR